MGDVFERARRKRLELEASKAGIPFAEVAEAKAIGITLQDGVHEYLKDISPPQRVAYKYCLEQFIATSKKRYVSEVENAPRVTSDRLVFPTQMGLPGTNHELKLKWVARRAGLNCGTCISRHGNHCSRGPYYSRFFLHKFRHTFATRNLQEAVCDIRTLQVWLRHTVIWPRGWNISKLSEIRM